MNLESAIQAHAEWKMKLRSAIQAKAQVDARSIASDNSCPLGKWLHGEAKAKYSGLKSYTACRDKHAAFHLEAGKVASAINAADYVKAEALLAGNTAFATSSSAVGVAILALRKEAAL
jgi:methyl-accepting chemotaxis protein